MPLDSFMLRALEPADCSATQALILAGLGEHFGAVDPDLNPDLKDLSAAYIAPGHPFVVAEVDGQVAGAGGLVVSGDTGQIVRVSVAPAFRRQGVGRALVATLIAAARTRGLRGVWMETNDDWYAARRLYESCGFRQFDQRDGCTFMHLEL